MSVVLQAHPTGPGADPDPQIVSYITSKGAYAIIDSQNFGRYYGNVISDTNGFQTYWKTIAARFKGNSKFIFDTNNEYHDMDDALVAKLNQAAINGIRAAGATSQYIFVEGNPYTGAWTWVCFPLTAVTNQNSSYSSRMPLC